MVNFKELLGNDNQLQNLLLDTVEEGEVYRLCLTKEEGIIPKNDLVEIKKAICSYENVSMKLLKRFGLI